MSDLNQFIGGDKPVKSLVNCGATPPTVAIGIPSSQQNTGGVVAALSGALTANQLATALSISGGGGYLDIFGLASVDATPREHRAKITLDGVVVYDKTGASVAATGHGILPVGRNDTYASYPSFVQILGYGVPLRFNNSCLVEFSSSVTETDKTNIFYSYRLTA